MRIERIGIAIVPSSEGLRYARVQAGLNQEEFAKRIGLSLTTVSRWERGVYEATRKHREALEEFCEREKIPYMEYQIGVLAVRLVTSHDRYTAGHSFRVGMLAGVAGRRVSGLDLRELRVAAVLHDLGKLICRQELLTKQDKYSQADREAVKEHAAASEALVALMLAMHSKAAKIAGQHHEKIDGGGYRGLRSKDILPEAKLLAVCDVFDALTTKRPYKEAHFVEDAIAILRADKGLDQGMVEHLVRVISKPGLLDGIEDDTHLFIYRDRRRFYRANSRNKRGKRTKMRR